MRAVKAMELEKKGTVVFIHMKKAHNQNKLTADMMHQLMHALDEAEAYEDATCLVTVGMGKYYSAGLDIDTETPLNHDLHQISSDMSILHALLARILTFPLPTIAAVTGHAFGGGAFLALAHDYSIMRCDRGWWCVPAARVGLQVPLPDGLLSLLRAKVPVSAQSQVLLARRFSGPEAEEAGIVHEVCTAGEMTERAAVVAAKLSNRQHLDRKTVATLKHSLYRDAYSTLSDGVSYSLKSKL